MKKLYLSGVFLCTYFGLHAQEVLWQKDIKSSTQDFLSGLTTTIDQQFVVTGSAINTSKLSSISSSGGSKQNNGYDFHAVKLNQQGEIVWDKFFSANNHDYLTATVSTQEGGFLLAGTSFSSKSGDKKEDAKGGSDIWIIKLDENGNEEWQKTIGSEADDEAKAVIQTTDLGYYVAGNTQNNKNGYGSKDVYVSRLNKKGEVTSQIILGGRGLDEVEKMIPTKDGGALIGIYSRSSTVETKPNNNQGNNNSNNTSSSNFSKKAKISNNEGEGDYWIVKLSNDGKVEWEKNFGGKGDDHLRTIANTSFGYIIGGESRSEKSGNKSVGIDEGTDIWLVAINERGDDIWQKSYNFKNRDVLMSLNTINNAKDSESKGFLLGGYTQAEGRIEENDETFWMLYLNQNGDEVWRKHIKGKSRKKEERLSDLKMNRDGSIVLAGTSAEELGKENWKIVKLGDKQIDELIEQLPMKIYPNPVSDYAYVEIGFDFKEAEIFLYDMGGRQLQNIKTTNSVTKINTSSLIQAAYLVVVKAQTKDNQTKIANSKLIKK